MSDGSSGQVEIGVLGPVTARVDGAEAPLGGPLQRAVLARLVVARSRVVTADRLVEDLWDDPPQGALATLRTFVAALRRGVEPWRTPRTPARLLVTDGPGYALCGVGVDAWSFEEAVTGARDLAPAAARTALGAALDAWRGTPYAGLDQQWAVAERARLTGLRLVATERHAEVRIALGQAADVVPGLDAHAAEHPLREEASRLLALALYRSGRQADALAVLRKARRTLAGELGIDPGPRLAALETQVLRHEVEPGSASAPDDVWRETTAAYERLVAAGARTRLESTATLLRTLAVTGGDGLTAARPQRMAAVRAAEQLGDPELTARVIGAFDVPGAWTRSDDADLAAQLVAAAERTLDTLPHGAPAVVRAKLLATVAIESRGLPGPRGPEAARQAEALARQAGDPAVLAFALAGRYLTCFERTGLARERDAIGVELLSVATRHGLSTFEILGHLVRLQALSALGRWDAAQQHANDVAALGRRHERPLVEVFTRWFAAMRTTESAASADAPSGTSTDAAEHAYRQAAATLDGSGMPGLADGLFPLAVLTLRVGHGLSGDGDGDRTRGGWGGWGPYEPWALPHQLLARGADAEAAAAVRRIPDPPPGLLTEVLWVLAGRAAITVGDRWVAERARAALAPAADEVAAGSGVLTAGPVRDHLAALSEFLTD